MNMRPFAISLSCFSLTAALTSTIQADAVVDRFLASQCAQCHGTNGYAVGDMDGLAGSEYDDLYDKLIDIKYKDDHDIMHFQIQGYRDDQLSRIADYYSGLPEGDGESERSSDD